MCWRSRTFVCEPAGPRKATVPALEKKLPARAMSATCCKGNGTQAPANLSAILPFSLCFRNRPFLFLRVIEERHETEVHVELLVTVEERKTRIVRNKVNIQLLISAEHGYVLYNASGFNSC